MKIKNFVFLYIMFFIEITIFPQQTPQKSLIFAQENSKKALVVFKKGNVSLIRNDKIQKITVNAILEEKDIIQTEKNSSVNIQFSDGVVIMIGPETRVEIKKLIKSEKGDSILLKQPNGETLAKVSFKKPTHLVIESPTSIASVRGTELLVNSSENSTTIAVNEGKVEVSNINGTQKETIEAGQKIIVSFQEMKKSILETYEKDKFRMIQELEKTRKQNLENVIQQIEKNQKILQEQKQKINIPSSPLQN